MTCSEQPGLSVLLARQTSVLTRVASAVDTAANRTVTDGRGASAGSIAPLQNPAVSSTYWLSEPSGSSIARTAHPALSKESSRMSRSAVVGTSLAAMRASVCALAVAAAMACGFTSAQAATPSTGYGPTGSFADGELVGGYGTAATAVQQSTGRILIADSFTSPDIRVYTPDLLMGGVHLADIAAGGSVSLAADPTNGAVYSVTGAGTSIAKFVPDGASPPNYTPDATFAAPAPTGGSGVAVAVDPTNHDLLVASPGAAAQRLSPNGTLLSTFDGRDTENGPFVLAQSVAVGPSGDIYVVDTSGPGRVERFSAAGVSLGRIPTAGAPQFVATNPVSGEVVVAEIGQAGRASLEGFTASGSPTFSARYPAGATGQVGGLAIDGGSGRIYSMYKDVTEADPTRTWRIEYFTRGVQAGLDAPVVSNVATDAAHVTGAVAPGGTATDAHFEYCPADADCSAYRFSDPTDLANPWQVLPDHSGLTSSTTIADDLSGLLPNKKYYVRSYATNGTTENVSAQATFTTLPAAPGVTTAVASDVSPTTAVLNGTIDACGSQTTYHFEYGTTTVYDLRTPQAAEGVAGIARTPRSFSRTVSGLLPSTTYHYRLVAQNAGGTTYGADQTFTTAATTTPVRGYEQVTPVDKAGGAINPVYGFHLKDDGSALEYALAAAPDGAPSALEVPRVMSTRGAADWSGWNFLDPPVSVTRTAFGAATLAVSADFGHVLVATNRKLTPQATEGAANLYVKDVATGAYTFVGQSTAPGALNLMIGIQEARMYLAGAPDFSWIVFESGSSLLPGAPTLALYKWTAQDGLALASRLPNGSVPAGDLDQLNKTQGPVRLVSEDGNVMAFALTNSQAGVYRRAGGQTTAISVSRVSGDPATPVPGRVVGMSRDGDAVVFTSGRLLAAAPPGDGNVYRYRASANTLTFLGTLASTNAAEDVNGVGDDGNAVYFNDGTQTLVSYDDVLRTVTTDRPGSGAFVSANGRFFVWLAGAAGDPIRDVYQYDVRSGTTVCASCRGDGSVGGHALLADAERNISNQRPLVVSDDGTVYFTTTDRLVAADHNGRRDVYAYSNGAPTLISPGDGDYDANYADATEDGHDVFFATTESLVGQDQDGEPDIYDARLGGGFLGQSPVVLAPCQKATCGPTSSGPVTSPPVVDQPRPSSPPAKRTNQVKVKVSLRKLTFTSKAMHVTLVATQHGRVRVTGTNIAITVRDVKKAGTYTVVVPLSKKAQGLKRRHKRFKVTARVAFTGGWTAASFKIDRTIRG